MAVAVRKLEPGEEPLTESFLARMPETTVFLRSSLATSGLTDDGSPFSGTYVGAFDEGGTKLVGVAAFFSNDNVVVAPGPHAELLAKRAIELAGREVAGILGPHDEVVRVRAALGLVHAATRLSSKEVLFTLQLEDLVLPAGLVERRVVARTPEAAELPTLLDWRMQYCHETMQLEDTPHARVDQELRLATYQTKGHHFLVTVDGERVAYSAFNATVADVVQIGGVWTPPALRGRGYARCVVAASLQSARDRGTRHAILFTPEQNLAAQRAYAAIGFRPIGSYGIVLFVR